MTTPIKDVVARLRELMAKATPGPWSTDAERPRLVNDGDGYFDEMGGGVPYDLGPDDAEFTVEAVNALPAILDRLETLEARKPSASDELLDAMAHDIKTATQHKSARLSGGQMVGAGGRLGLALPARLHISMPLFGT